MSLPAIVADPGPLARLEHVKAQADTPSVVFQRLCEGETLKAIAKAWQIPAGLFTEWFTSEHLPLFDAAMRVRADELAHEALQKADQADAETVAPSKLQVDTRLKLASFWDRNRYGAGKDAGSAGVTVLVDRSCGGQVEVKAPGGSKVVIGAGSAEALPAEEAPI